VLEKLRRRELPAKLVGAYGVVDFLPLPQFAIQGGHFQPAARHLIKLFGLAPLGTFVVCIGGR
jgi:hypothetical protein